MPNRTSAETDALHTIAAAILSRAVQEFPQWEDYPEIGESDWFRICEILDAKAPAPSASSFKAAYALLEARAAAHNA